MGPGPNSGRVLRSACLVVRAGETEPRADALPWSDASPRDRSRGFALLEVMACAAVLTIALVMFLAAIAQNAQLEEMNSETNIALHAAGEVIERVHSLTYGEVGYAAISPTFEATGEGIDGGTIRLTNSAASTQVGQVTITEDVLGTTKTVLVRVLWRSVTGGDRSMTLMTEVTNY
ncbi:MAG: hypothetical protein AMS16_05160 [Planctomycetes bacterium DG_58]|nr:MAG: hypothetical protein AMS16_05160 [Planctomycetes bacterium DG_58]